MLPPQNTKTEQIFDLKKALAFANDIVNTVREPLVVLYPKLTIYSVNKAFYKTFKTKPKDTIGKHFYDLGDKQWNIPLLKELLEKTLSASKSFHDFEVEHQFKTIGHKTMLLNGRKLHVLNKNQEMTLLAIEDISDRKETEKKLENEKAVVEQNKHLLELAKQKDDFFSITSHELKTPVTILKVFITLLQESADLPNADRAEMLLKMNEQTNKLTHRINDLLDAAKMQGGKLKYNMSHFNFNSLVKETTDEMQLTTRKHTIVTKFSAPVTVFADKERIEQVIINFLSNAIKYSPASKKIIISAISDSKQVKLSVQDFGIGMPAEDQEDVFKKFFRVKGKTESTYPGLGLGLFLSAEIIERHKGTIHVKSVKGKGSTFNFVLPINRNAAPKPTRKLKQEKK